MNSEGGSNRTLIPLGAAILPTHASSSFVSFRTLLTKEMLRFWKVSFQTIAAPVLTAVLYLLVFGHVLEEHVQALPGVSYTAFLIPGLVMMSVLQNAFANSSSSLIQSKIMGSLIFVLLPPFSHWQLFGAYVGASMVRGLVVGLGVFVITAAFAPPSFARTFVDHRFWRARRRDAGNAWSDRRHLVRQVRSAGGVSELHRDARHISIGRVLLGAEPAAVLADGVALQPVLLHDRRLSLRVLCAV